MASNSNQGENQLITTSSSTPTPAARFPIDLPALRAQRGEAFADLGFEVNDTRSNNFLQLCIQFFKHRGGNVVVNAEHKNLRITSTIVLDYCVAAFIHHFGEHLWPASGLRRGHIVDGGSVPTPDLVAGVQKKPEIPGAYPMSFWMKYLESPLGIKVKRYFETLEKIPWYMLPEYGVSSHEGVKDLVRRVLDTSADR